MGGRGRQQTRKEDWEGVVNYHVERSCFLFVQIRDENVEGGVCDKFLSEVLCRLFTIGCDNHTHFAKKAFPA